MIIPNVIYKIFDEKKYALNLINQGEFKVGTVRSFKTIEDSARRDESENSAIYQCKEEHLSVDKDGNLTRSIGIVTTTVGAGGDDSFIYCMTAPQSGDIAHTQRKFGKFYVRIKDVAQFLKDFQIAIDNNKTLSELGTTLDYSMVSYTKNTYLGALTREELLRLGWSQKPDAFKSEHEFRIRFWADNTLVVNNDKLILCVGRKLDYCELITRMPPP